jgi:nucleoside-diphosphate-sugar epimerase
MRVFVAGATGTLGRPVVRLLIEHGHQVVGSTRSAGRKPLIESLGAEAVLVDALDREALRDAVVHAQPEVVVHLLTAIPPGGALRPRDLAPTNQLRTVGTAHLVSAAVCAKARRLVTESFIGVYGVTHLDSAITEDDPLPPPSRGPFSAAVAALRAMEQQVWDVHESAALDTVVLRVGLLYGAEVPSMKQMIRQSRAGWLAAPAGDGGLVPLVHLDDAAAAIVAAIEAPEPSRVYNVVDDEPMSLTAFVDALSRSVGGKRPPRIPRWMLRVAAPIIADVATARLPVCNEKAKRELAWRLRYPSVAAGLREIQRMASEAA